MRPAPTRPRSSGSQLDIVIAELFRRLGVDGGSAQTRRSTAAAGRGRAGEAVLS